jgi:hypothetical protein
MFLLFKRLYSSHFATLNLNAHNLVSNFGRFPCVAGMGKIENLGLSALKD